MSGCRVDRRLGVKWPEKGIGGCTEMWGMHNGRRTALSAACLLLSVQCRSLDVWCSLYSTHVKTITDI